MGEIITKKKINSVYVLQEYCTINILIPSLAGVVMSVTNRQSKSYVQVD